MPEKSLAYNTAHNSAIIRVLHTLTHPHTPTYYIIIVVF